MKDKYKFITARLEALAKGLETAREMRLRHHQAFAKTMGEHGLLEDVAPFELLAEDGIGEAWENVPAQDILDEDLEGEIRFVLDHAQRYRQIMGLIEKY